jgi:type IV pilus assembly protein PilM
MFKFLSLQEDAFGLDINDLSLKIVKLQKKSRGFVLASYNEAKIASGIIEDGVIEDENSLAKIIKSACSSVNGKKIKTKNVVASLPEEKSFLQVIQMPIMSEEELKTAVPLEAENYIPLPIEQVYLDFQVIAPVKDYFNNLDVLIIATPKKIVDSYVSCIERAGFLPVALEVESQSIARALVKAETNACMMTLIDFGDKNTNLIIFSGKSIRFTASMPISSNLLTDIDEPIVNDLALQIKKYLNFYKDHSSYEYLLTDKKTEKILLCGAGAGLKGLPEFLSKKLGVQVEVGDPLVNFSVKKPKTIIKKNLTSYTGAIGLALREINGNL